MFIDRKIAITLVAGILISLILLFPVSLIINNIEMPDRVQVKVYKGNILSGNANLFVKPSDTSYDQLLLLSWDLCASGSFPFVAFCWKMKGGEKEHTGKLIGIPGDNLVLEKISTSIAMETITDLLSIGGSSVAYAILRVRGSVDVMLDKLVVDTVNNLPSRWDGRVELNSGGFFNLDLPQIVFLMSNEGFIKSADNTGNSDTFGRSKLPTIRFQGADDTMDIAGSIQLLPDNQVKVSIEILARDPLALQTFAPLSTNREGNRLFISYQGALGT